MLREHEHQHEVHGLGHREDLGLVAIVVRRVGVRLERGEGEHGRGGRGGPQSRTWS